MIIIKIGIAVRKDNKDYFVHRTYISLLKKYNLNYDFISINSNLNQYEGFLIPGGYDINPINYNENNTNCYNIDDEIDDLDKKIILHAVENKKPLLGICRGLQSINVFLNGSMYQNIDNHDKNNHFILFKNKYYLVNSYHHQAIKKIGANLKILSKSLDGHIEIIKHDFLPILGIQFHPELLNSDINDFLMLIFNES